MIADHIPLFGLRLTTPRLQLRLPSLSELAALADVAASGIHDPAVMPFNAPWTDQPPALVARSTAQYYFRVLGDWSPQQWALNLTVFLDGQPVGLQGMSAKDFAITREVSTGSWLGRRYHGQGIGTEMRAAVLHLAFAGLDATEATSSAFDDNLASQRVSEKLGYQRDGQERRAVRDRLTVVHRLRMSRQRWQQHQRVPVTIDGLEPCRSWFEDDQDRR